MNISARLRETEAIQNTEEDIWPPKTETSRTVSEMFPFKKKKESKGPPKQHAARDIPSYRRDERSVEYDSIAKVDEPTVGPADGKDAAVEVAGDDFQPLPRCSHCGTAIGYNQRICHGCEKESRGF